MYTITSGSAERKRKSDGIGNSERKSTKHQIEYISQIKREIVLLHRRQRRHSMLLTVWLLAIVSLVSFDC